MRHASVADPEDGFDPMRLVMVVGAVGIIAGAALMLFVFWLYGVE